MNATVRLLRRERHSWLAERSMNSAPAIRIVRSNDFLTSSVDGRVRAFHRMSIGGAIIGASVQGLVKICQQIFEILNSDGHPDQTRVNAEVLLVLGRDKAVRSLCGQTHQCFDSSQT